VLGVSVNTVRTQLKRALAKTRTGRQAELVRLALGTPAMLGR
jgi:DNA-binding CsgD family transcriptional regulator